MINKQITSFILALAVGSLGVVSGYLMSTLETKWPNDLINKLKKQSN